MTAKYGPEHLIYLFPYFYPSGLMVCFKTKQLNLVFGKQAPLDSWHGSSCTSYGLPIRLDRAKNGLCHVNKANHSNITPQIHNKLNMYGSQ